MLTSLYENAHKKKVRRKLDAVCQPIELDCVFPARYVIFVMPFHLFPFFSFSLSILITFSSSLTSFVFPGFFLFMFLVWLIPLHFRCLRNFVVYLSALLFCLLSTYVFILHVVFRTNGIKINDWSNDLFIKLLYLSSKWNYISRELPSIRDWRLTLQMTVSMIPFIGSTHAKCKIKYLDWCVRVST